MGHGLDKPTATRAKALFAEWLERTGDHRLAADRAGVSERTGRRWRSTTTPAPLRVERPRTNLPSEATRYVGRGRALASIRGLFAGGARVVTIFGPGGMGKTRLATRYADVHALDYASGAWFCDLSQARTQDDVCAAVASALGVPLARTDAVTQVGHVLAARGRVLVILDNAEQIASLAHGAFDAWVGAAPRAHFLVTSRAQLRLHGESAWELDALELPEAGNTDVGRIAASEAVELFVDRARLVRPGYALAKDDAPFVRDLVRRLDGVPLAIELCAARMAILPPRELCLRMEQRFELLVGRTRGTTTRQASMRATIDASWELLDDVERAALAQCAVFCGGFTVSAAEHVVRLPVPALDIVQSLVEKSLVFARSDETGARRLGMYESIRDYAASRLAEVDPREEAAVRHATYYAAYGAELAAKADVEASSRDRLWLELDNITEAHDLAVRRATSKAAHDLAVQRALTDAALSAALATSAALHPRGMLAREIASLDAALACPDGATGLRARALAARANARRVLGRTEAALRDARDAEALCDARDAEALRDARDAESLGDARRATTLPDAPEAEARANDAALVAYTLATVQRAAGSLDDAENAYRRVLSSSRPSLVARAAMGLALLYRLRRRPAEALAFAERALALLDGGGDLRLEAETRLLLATLQQSEGRFDDARDTYARALALLETAEEPGLAATILTNLATLEHELGHLEKARLGAERALGVFRALGAKRQEACVEGNLASVHAELGRVREARAGFERAIAILRAVGDRVHEGLFLAQLASVLARQDDIERAERTLREAEEILRPNREDPLFGSLDAQRAFLVLARARRAARRGDREESTTLRDEVLATVEGLDAQPWTDDVRVAVRTLRRALADGDAPSGATLVVSDEGREVRAPSGTTLSLAERKAPRLLFMRLVEERERAPGKPLGVDDLLAAGWPGERVLADAGASRVYVALGTLRKLGLRSVLLSRDGGYLLDPRVAVQRL